jgi:hypothetical protein
LAINGAAADQGQAGAQLLRSIAVGLGFPVGAHPQGVNPVPETCHVLDGLLDLRNACSQQAVAQGMGLQAAECLVPAQRQNSQQDRRQ